MYALTQSHPLRPTHTHTLTHTEAQINMRNYTCSSEKSSAADSSRRVVIVSTTTTTTTDGKCERTKINHELLGVWQTANYCCNAQK